MNKNEINAVHSFHIRSHYGIIIETTVHVNVNAPKTGSQTVGMKFLGQTELASFLAEHPAQAETLRAWVREIQHRVWRSSEALAAYFPNVNASHLPRVVFRVGRPTLTIETLVDFRNGVVLMTEIRDSGIGGNKFN